MFPNNLLSSKLNNKFLNRIDVPAFTDLHHAIFHGNTEKFIFWTTKAKNINFWFENCPLIIYACAYADKADNKILKFLINNCEAEVNTISTDGTNNTPLHIAVKNQNAAAVNLLLSAGAFINLRDSAGKTALDIAQNISSQKVVSLLKDAYCYIKLAEMDDLALQSKPAALKHLQLQTTMLVEELDQKLSNNLIESPMLPNVYQASKLEQSLQNDEEEAKMIASIFADEYCYQLESDLDSLSEESTTDDGNVDDEVTQSFDSEKDFLGNNSLVEQISQLNKVD